MSTESLTLHFSDETLLVRPRASLDSVSAPFLAEEAYPRILRALLDTHLGDGDEDRIILSEDNIAAIASAASRALFGEDDVFARFLVVPRVESAISVLLWRVRINSTCAGTITEGQTGIQLPSVPVRVLASSLAGLLDNTKLYASSKQVAFPAPHTPLQKHESRLDHHHHHHLAPPTPVTAHSDPCLPPSALARPPPPRLSFSRPMTPPDSAVVETTPISATDSFLTPTTPTSKRTGLPRVKFRPPPIITRTTPSRPIPRLTQSAGAVTLTFAAAALSGCEIEPLSYAPKTKEQPTTDNVVEPDKEDEKASNDDDDEEDPPPSPPPTAKPKLTRPPSPKPRAPSPTKRVLRKAPPTPKSRPKSIIRSPSPTKPQSQSMWAPAGAEAHYRSPSPAKLTPPVRTRSMLGAGSRTGSIESSPALPKNVDLPSSSSSPALVPRSKLRAPSPAPRTPSPGPMTMSLVDDRPSPSPSQSMPGSSLRSPSSNLLRSPGSSMFNSSSVGFGSPAGSVLDVAKTPVTPIARRTVSVSGVKFEVIESPAPSRHPSWPVHQPATPSRTPPAQDTLSPSPNALRTRLGASPGATSLSTVPSLSPFPDSDSDGEFGVKKEEEEDVTVTSRMRGLGLTRTITPPTRASTSTPTRKSPPPINTSSPSRNSKRSYTLGVPMTQLSSHPPTIHNMSESEAESLAFPGSTSTLSLPGDISLPELVSPFTTPLELGPSSSSGGESPLMVNRSGESPTRARFGDAPTMLGAGAGFGGKREPLPLPRGAGPVVNAGAGPGSVSHFGSESADHSRMGSSFVSEPLSSSVLASAIQSRSGSVPPAHSRSGSFQQQQQRSGSVPPAHSRSGSVPSTQSRSGSVPPTPSRSGSMQQPTPSRPGSTHSRSGSQAQVRLGGRESEMDLLVPFAMTRALSQTDVLRLMNKSGSSTSSGTDSPNRTSMVGGPPVPVFMAPGSAQPSQVGKRMSLVRSPPSTSSESTNPSPLAPTAEAVSHSRIPSETSVDDTDDTEDDYIVRTAEVEVGAGRARIQSGVGIGGGRARGGKRTKTKVDKDKVDSALARSASAATARPRVDSVRTRTESTARARLDSVVRARVDSMARPRVESATRPRVDSNVRSRVDSGLRRKSGADDLPVSPARSPSSASASARRVVGRKPSGEVLGRRTPIGRKASAASMRKSSTSSLRSTATAATRTTPVTVSTKKTSVSSVSRTSTPQSGTSTPRSRSMSMGNKENGTGIPTPKQSGTPRPSLSTPRTSMSSGRNIGSPRPSVTIPRPSATSPKSSPRTPVTPTNKTPVARPPPARPQRSSLRPGPRANTLSTSAPAVTQAPVSYTSTEFDPTPLTAPAVSAPSLPSAASPPRMRATSLDTSPAKAHLGTDDSRPRRVTSISSKAPPLSRSSVSVASTLAPPPVPPPIRARASSRTNSSTGHEDGAVPFPIPESASESEGGLKVPDTPRGPKRSLSVSSAARRFVNRARGASPVPSMPTPATDNVSLASSMEKPPVQEKAPKSGRSLSRLAFSALMPKRAANNAAAEAKAALAQAKAREVAEAKARAKAAVEEAKARAKAEAEAKAAAKEPRRLARRFGSMSKKTSVAG